MIEALGITHFINNRVATIFLANSEKEFDRKKMIAAFNEEKNVKLHSLKK